MITISMHIPSLVIGFLIGGTVLSTMWFLFSADNESWGDGWHYGYRSGIEEGIKREKSERERQEKMKEGENR